MNRQEANLEICKHITDFFLKEEHSHIRFWQGLFDIGIINGKILENDILHIQNEYNKESLPLLHKLKIF